MQVLGGVHRFRRRLGLLLGLVGAHRLGIEK